MKQKMFDKSELGCLAIIGILILAIALIFAEVWIAMALWNWLIVSLFAGPALTYWQMFGIKILLGILIPTSTNISTKK